MFHDDEPERLAAGHAHRPQVRDFHGLRRSGQGQRGRDGQRRVQRGDEAGERHSEDDRIDDR